MRTTLNIDEGILEDVLIETAEKSKSKAVNKALEEYVRGKKIDKLRAMLGNMQIDDVREEQRAADLKREKLLDKLRGH